MKTKARISTLIVALAISGILLLPTNPPAAAAKTSLQQAPTPTPLPDPLSQPLPNTGQPQSSWRPPLYPVPWALNENDHFYFLRPVAVSEVNWPLASYRYGGIFFSPDAPHTGVDIVVPEGTPIFAAAGGQVIWSGTGLLFGDENPQDPYGIAIAIKHDFGWENEPLFTLYAHLSEAQVEKGDYVKAGELIALSGNTGMTTGPHLHFEVRLGSNNFYLTFNPELWLVPPQGWGVIVGKLTDAPGEKLIRQEVVLTNQETGQQWHGQTYGSEFTLNPDPFYGENFAISDLPAGEYLVRVPYKNYVYKYELTVHPGAVSYFRFRGPSGFSDFQPYHLPPTSLPASQ